MMQDWNNKLEKELKHCYRELRTLKCELDETKGFSNCLALMLEEKEQENEQLREDIGCLALMLTEKDERIEHLQADKKRPREEEEIEEIQVVFDEPKKKRTNFELFLDHNRRFKWHPSSEKK